MVFFLFWEFSYASQPIVDKRIFNTWAATSAYIQTMVHGLILYASIYFLSKTMLAAPYALMLIILHSPILPGRKALLASNFSHRIAARDSRPLPSERGGWSPNRHVEKISMGLVGRLGSYHSWFRSFIPPGYGDYGYPMGLLEYTIRNWDRHAFHGRNPDHPSSHRVGAHWTFGINLVLIYCRPELNGEAAAFFSFIRVLGQAFGVAISGVIFQNTLKGNLLRIPGFASLADEYSRDATAIVSLIQSMPDGGTKTRVIQAFSDSLQSIWLELVAFSAAGLLLSLTVKGYSMTQEHVTSQHLVQEKDSGGNEEAGVTGNSGAKKS